MSRSPHRWARLARAARISAAALVLGLAAYGFLAAGDAAELAARAVASWQLFPAAERALAAAISGFGAGGATACVAALAILALSAALGRWYCAALCPLGTAQDLASLLRARQRQRRGPRRGARIAAGRSYAAPHRALRASAFVAVLCLAVAGAASLASWLDPWSLFGRFFAYDLRSLLRLALREDQPALSAVSVAASGIAFAAVLAASFLSGRWFCGDLCPVGSALGLLNTFAPFRVRLESSKCLSCGSCASVCRASCIDTAAKSLDSSRCVNCLACIAVCPTGALRYGRALARPERAARGTAASPNAIARAAGAPAGLVGSGPGAAAGRARGGMSRAQFLWAAGGGALAVVLAALPGRAFAARTLRPAADPRGPRPVTPPGSRSLERFAATCTACGLCVDRCPAKLLVPSYGQLGAGALMAPVLDHSISYCQFDCKACVDACPSGALEKLSLERKKLTKIGDATLVASRCVVFTKGTKCGACAEHCPTGAVRMVVGETGLPEPVFTSSICIGCGACHHACPVRPDRAISVSGLAVHETAQAPSPNLFETKPASGSDESAFPF